MWKHWSINKIKPFMFAFIVNNRGNGRRIVFQYTNILKSLDIIARIKIISKSDWNEIYHTAYCYNYKYPKFLSMAVSAVV